MTCRTCKFLEIMPNAAAKRVARKGNVYCCLAPVPKTSWLLPASVTKAYGYREPDEKSKAKMKPDDGAGCPLYEPRS